jgi:hypothetical protein
LTAVVLNGLSVDIEDWFQVGAFERTIRRDDWDSLMPRVERNSDAVLAPSSLWVGWRSVIRH